MRTQPTFLNLVLLSGEPCQKLQAARDAGFDQVEIWREDVEAHSGGAAALAEIAACQGPGFTNLQVLRDFSGAPGELRAQKREELRQFIQMAQALGCDTIQAPATTREDCCADQIDDDLRWMASEAARHNMRIMYEPMPGAAWITHCRWRGSDCSGSISPISGWWSISFISARGAVMHHSSMAFPPIASMKCSSAIWPPFPHRISRA